MAISVTIYSNANATTNTINVDFLADLLASSSNGVSDELKYFFKFSTGGNVVDEEGKGYSVRLAESLTDVVLNKEKQRMVNSASPYTDIKSMIVDYTYDYIYGHAAGEYGTSVGKKAPMNFSR